MILRTPGAVAQEYAGYTPTITVTTIGQLRSAIQTGSLAPTYPLAGPDDVVGLDTGTYTADWSETNEVDVAGNSSRDRRANRRAA